MNEIPIHLEFVLINHLFKHKTNLNEEEFIDEFSRNQLICFINNKSFEHLFESNNYMIGSILSNNNIQKQITITSNALFICIKSLNNQSFEDNCNESIKLIVSQQFLTHYNLSVFDKHLFFKFVANCPQISKITIGVKTNELYETVKSDVWSQKLLNSVSNCGVKLLCRRNDWFTGNEDLIVLNCEPILQGIITLNTEIIVINVSNDKQNYNISSESEINESVKLNENNDNKMVKALHLMNFTSRLLLKPTIDGNCDHLKTSNTTAIQTFTASTSFLNAISFSFQIVILSNTPLIPDIDSENGCIFVSNNALINKLKCNPKDWARIWLSSNDKAFKSRQRFSQLHPIDSITDDNIAYISPQLWFNLQSLSSHEFCDQPLLQPNTTLMIRKENSFVEQISFSSAVHISLIQSPEYSANNDYSYILKNYFEKTRYVLKDDVIGVSTREDPLFNLNAKEVLSYEWPVVYFRVTLIEGNGSLIDVNNSKLYQTGTMHSLIPATLSSYYSENNLISVENSPNPVGLTGYVNNLCDLVFPYLMPKSKTIGTIMISGPLGSGRKTIVKSMCKHWNLHLYQINSNDIIGETATSTESKIKICFSKAAIYAPCILFISNINLLCNNELYDDPRIAKAFSQALHELTDINNEWPIIVIATNFEPKKSAHNELNSLFMHSIDIDCPNAEERENIIKSLIGQICISTDVNLSEYVQKTVGFYYGDLFAFVSNALKQLFSSFSDTKVNESDVALSGVVLTNKHLIYSLNELQRLHSDSIGSPNIPDVKWDDIGGHEHIKSEILDTIQLPYECPQLINLGFRRSGVLLYGPPGTGKTLLVKAAATQCSLNFLSVKGPELINMYVGQSEQNVRDIFNKARKCAPSVIFFDELDSLAPNRGQSGDSGGVMDRVVSQLLAEMDGMNKSNDVFVIGATNRPDLLDSALLRPGRFDRLLYVGIADDSESRLKILRALTKKFNFDDDMDLEQIESVCPHGLSGADFYSLCSNALMNAIDRNIEEMTNNDEINEENCEIRVKLSDFMSALPKMTATASQ